MKNFNLPALLMMLLVFLLSLFPAYVLMAQNTTGSKQLRIKMIKNVNGEVQIIDTVVTGKDHEDALHALKGLDIDPARLDRIEVALGKVFSADSLLGGNRLKGIFYDGNATKVDTIMFRKMSGDSLRVYRLNRTLNADDTAKLLERVNVYRTDTASFKFFQDRQAAFYKLDSTNQYIFRKSILSEAGDTIRFDAMVPSVIGDSIRVFRLGTDGEALRNIRIDSIDRIVVQGGGSRILKLDTSSTAMKHRFEITTDEKTGERHIYVINEDGVKKEIDADKRLLNAGDKTVVIMLKTDVQRISTADKELLLNAGREVESSKKETLKIDDVAFYPNPNDGHFQLKFNLSDGGDAAIRIMNSNGKEIYRELVKGSTGQYNKQIDISGMGKGIFYLQVVQGERYATRKILIQ